jgi:hypothetical protein
LADLFNLDLASGTESPFGSDDAAFASRPDRSARRTAPKRTAQADANEYAQFGDPERGGGKRQRRAPRSFNAYVRDDLKAMGVEFQLVEHHNAHSGKKQDLFGFGDWLYIADVGTVALQVTGRANVLEHIRGVAKDPDKRRKLLRWLASGQRWEIWGYYNENGAPMRRLIREVTKGDIDTFVAGGRLSLMANARDDDRSAARAMRRAEDAKKRAKTAKASG